MQLHVSRPAQQLDGKSGSLLEFAGPGYPATVQFYDHLHDGQSQAAPFRFGFGQAGSPIEAAEDVRKIFRSNARSRASSSRPVICAIVKRLGGYPDYNKWYSISR